MNKNNIFLNSLINLSISLSIFMSLSSYAQTNTSDFINNYSISENLKVPVRVAIDKTDNIFVTDFSQKCIVQYDATRNFVRKIFVGEEPNSITISDNNTMFVGDCVNGKIYKRLSNGTISLIYSDTIIPSSMVVSPDNLLYIVDSRSKRVLVMNFAGNLIRTIGDGIFIFPTGIAYDNKNNRIIVSEHGGLGTGFNLHTEIRIFGITGNLISTFGGWGNTEGQFYRIQGLAVGKCGNIYVTDPFQGNVSVFTSDGTYITKFGQWGNALGQLNVPMDLVFDSHERVLVTSLNNSSIEIFDITDSLPTSTINTGSVSICNGSSTPIEFKFTGTSPWSFTYNINGTNPQTIITSQNPYILNTSIAGAYNVISLSDANHNGTCFSNTANVILNPMPTSNIANIHSNICPGEYTNIPVTFTGTPPWSFTYNNNGVNPITISDIYSNPYILRVNNVGSYHITSLTGGNCVGTSFIGSATVSVTPSPVSNIASGNVLVCDGVNTDIQVGLTGNPPWNLSYTINNTTPITLTNITTNPYTLTVSNPGKYKIISLSDANCPGTTFNGNFVVVNRESPLSNIVSGNNSICANDSAAITLDLLGSAPWSFVYTIDGTNPSLVSNINNNQYTFYTHQPGNYKIVSLTDAYCDGINFFGNSNISVRQFPIVVLGPDTNICFGQTLTLNGGIYESYLWNDQTAAQTLTVSSTGTYSLTATDDNGCHNFDQVYVNVSNPPLSSFIYNVNNLEIHFTNNTTNANSFLWDFGDGTTSTEANPMHLYNAIGNYIVTLSSNSISCGNSVFIDTVKVLTTSLVDNTLNSISFFPNPSNGIITIDINNQNFSQLKLEVFNSLGQSVYIKEISSNQMTEQVNLKHLTSGVYSIKFMSGDMNKIAKLILNN